MKQLIRYGDLLPSLYFGDKQNGKRQGFGVQFFLSQNLYIGEWFQDQAEGIGKIVYMDGTVIQGEFAKNQLLQGFINFSDGARFEGTFDGTEEENFLNGSFAFANGIVLDGQWNQGQLTNGFVYSRINPKFETISISFTNPDYHNTIRSMMTPKKFEVYGDQGIVIDNAKRTLFEGRVIKGLSNLPGFHYKGSRKYKISTLLENHKGAITCFKFNARHGYVQKLHNPEIEFPAKGFMLFNGLALDIAASGHLKKICVPALGEDYYDVSISREIVDIKDWDKKLIFGKGHYWYISKRLRKEALELDSLKNPGHSRKLLDTRITLDNVYESLCKRYKHMSDQIHVFLEEFQPHRTDFKIALQNRFSTAVVAETITPIPVVAPPLDLLHMFDSRPDVMPKVVPNHQSTQIPSQPFLFNGNHGASQESINNTIEVMESKFSSVKKPLNHQFDSKPTVNTKEPETVIIQSSIMFDSNEGNSNESKSARPSQIETKISPTKVTFTPKKTSFHTYSFEQAEEGQIIVNKANDTFDSPIRATIMDSKSKIKVRELTPMPKSKNRYDDLSDKEDSNISIQPITKGQIHIEEVIVPTKNHAKGNKNISTTIIIDQKRLETKEQSTTTDSLQDSPTTSKQCTANTIFEDECFLGVDEEILFIGKRIAGLKEGLCTIFYKNGWKYKGMYQRNKKQGKGQIINSNSELFIGNFIDDKPSGVFIKVAANGNIYRGTIVNSKFICRTEKVIKNFTVVGEIKDDDTFEGEGVLHSKDYELVCKFKNESLLTDTQCILRDKERNLEHVGVLSLNKREECGLFVSKDKEVFQVNLGKKKIKCMELTLDCNNK